MIVDDEPSVLETLRGLLELENYVVVAGSGGKRAIELLTTDTFDLVLADLRMPEVDGITVLERAKVLQPSATRCLLTGFTEVQDVLRAINRGEVYRYVVKPWQPEELLSIVSQALERKRLVDVERDVELAKRVQGYWLPKELPCPRGFELGAYYSASHLVAGDYYDVLTLDDNRLGFCVADVAGKGMGSAMIMAETRALLRSEASRCLSPRETLVRVNEMLHRDLGPGYFVTMIYGILSVPDRTLTLARAGHPPLIHFQRKKRKVSFVGPAGMALAINMNDFQLMLQEKTIEIAEGDWVVAYSDGVTEVTDSRGQLLGKEGFGRVIESLCLESDERLMERLAEKLDGFRGKVAFDDDVTILTVRSLPQVK